MSTDFLSRVRAEALRRFEEERFESAVIAEMRKIRVEEERFERAELIEMKKIREEERIAAQVPAYHKFHEQRREKLLKAREKGRIDPTVANIETAVSSYALGNITLDGLYTFIEVMDRDYPNKYVQSFHGRRIGLHSATITLSTPARAGVPIGFQLYLELALGNQSLLAREKREKFNAASMAAVN
jgi:hypothetical protein